MSEVAGLYYYIFHMLCKSFVCFHLWNQLFIYIHDVSCLFTFCKSTVCFYFKKVRSKKGTIWSIRSLKEGFCLCLYTFYKQTTIFNKCAVIFPQVCLLKFFDCVFTHYLKSDPGISYIFFRYFSGNLLTVVALLKCQKLQSCINTFLTNFLYV